MKARLDRLGLAGMGVGVVLMLQPWWDGGLRAGFFATLGSTLVHIIASHRSPEG